MLQATAIAVQKVIDLNEKAGQVLGVYFYDGIFSTGSTRFNLLYAAEEAIDLRARADEGTIVYFYDAIFSTCSTRFKSCVTYYRLQSFTQSQCKRISPSLSTLAILVSHFQARC